MLARIHHLNCATLCPAAWLPRRGSRPLPRTLVAHCLLLERADGLTLVDTGLGTADLADRRRLGAPFLRMVGPVLDPAETAVARVRALGFEPGDVTDVVLTHLDCDHAGGLGDFPAARVHLHAAELAAARARRSVREKRRYLPVQWGHGPRWLPHGPENAVDWFRISATPVLSDDVLLVALPGHTRGHSGVAVRRPDGGWLLHAGDAYFFTGEKEQPPSCPPGLRLFQEVVQVDRAARLASAARVRELHAAFGSQVTVFCAHDAAELDALTG